MGNPDLTVQIVAENPDATVGVVGGQVIEATPADVGKVVVVDDDGALVLGDAAGAAQSRIQLHQSVPVVADTASGYLVPYSAADPAPFTVGSGLAWSDDELPAWVDSIGAPNYTPEAFVRIMEDGRYDIAVECRAENTGTAYNGAQVSLFWSSTDEDRATALGAELGYYRQYPYFSIDADEGYASPSIIVLDLALEAGDLLGVIAAAVTSTGDEQVTFTDGVLVVTRRGA